MTEFEVSISMTYENHDPIRAAKQFLGSVSVSSWFVKVKDMESGTEYLVDSETLDLEVIKEMR